MGKRFSLLFVLLSLSTKVKGIVNGTEVYPPGKYPFIIHGGSCAAVLVAPNVAIGAAHCCYTKLRIGAHNITENDGEVMEVTESVTHPKFNRDTKKNNIVIMRLNGFSSYSPIGLEEFIIDEMDLSTRLRLIGWGSPSYGELSSTILEEVDIDYIGVLNCRNMYKKLSHLDYYQNIVRAVICAGKNENTEKKKRLLEERKNTIAAPTKKKK